MTIRVTTEAGETVTTILIEGQLTSSSVPDVRAACESDAGRMAGEVAKRAEGFYKRQGWL